MAGLLFAFHGLQKLFGMFGGRPVALASQMGAAGIIEFVGGLLIAIGFLTVPAAFVACGEMAYAYFTAHQPAGRWPIQNRGELAVLFCFVFLFIFVRGAGEWSVDGLTHRSWWRSLAHAG
jgi:putative oxidoreductase